MGRYDNAGVLNIDSSRIAYVKKMAEEIRKRLAIQGRMLEKQSLVSDEGIDPAGASNKPVTERADEALRLAD